MSTISSLNFNMVDVPVLEPEAVATASNGEYASRSDWNRVRPLIKRLYDDENKTLKEVMTIMARDYGFQASMKMYKARITKWGLDKKTKEAEAWAVLRKKMQRDAVGKDSAFRVRGKTVTIDDVLRYFKRKGILDPEVQPQSPEASTPPAIECWTPSLSPTLGFITIQEDCPRGDDSLEFRSSKMNGVSWTTFPDSTPGNDERHLYLNVDQTRQVIFSSPKIQSFEIPHSPLPPRSLLVPEKLFASIKAYYDGAFSSRLFITDKQGDFVEKDDSVARFYELCSTGADLMLSKSFVEGRRCFSKASDLLSHVIRGQSARSLQCILDVFTFLRRTDHNEIVRILRSLAHGLAIMFFDEEHPWREVLSQIGNLDDSHFELALTEAYRCVCDTFADLLGQFHRTTLFCYTGFLASRGKSDCAPKTLHDLLIQAEQALSKFDHRLLDIKFQYGQALYFQNRNAEAIAILKETVAAYWEIGGLELPISSALSLISRCQYHMGQQYEAESTLRLAIKISTEGYGCFHPMVLGLKARLETWLRAWGREMEAALLKAEIDDLLGPDDIELEDATYEEF